MSFPSLARRRRTDPGSLRQSLTDDSLLNFFDETLALVNTLERTEDPQAEEESSPIKSNVVTFDGDTWAEFGLASPHCGYYRCLLFYQHV